MADFKVIITYELTDSNDRVDLEYNEGLDDLAAQYPSYGGGGGGSTGTSRDLDFWFESENEAGSFLQQALQYASRLGMIGVEGNYVDMEELEESLPADYDEEAEWNPEVVTLKFEILQGPEWFDKAWNMPFDQSPLGHIQNNLQDLAGPLTIQLDQSGDLFIVDNVPEESEEEVTSRIYRFFYGTPVLVNRLKTAATRNQAMIRRTAARAYMAEEEILNSLLDKVSVLNSMLTDMVKFKEDLRDLQLDEDAYVDPMAEKLMGIYENLAKDLKASRGNLIEELAKLGGAGGFEEEELEEEAL